MSIEILGRHTSYNVQKVLWFLEELEIEYSHTQLGGKFGGTDTEEFKRKNPFSKVPVLIDADESVCESNTILRYLAASYGELDWWLDTPIQRAAVERWMDWSIDVLERASVGVFWGYYRTSVSNRDVAKIQVNKEKCEYCLTKIEQSLAESEFLVKNSISLADISVGVYIYRLVEIDLGITLPSNTASWYQKLISRPGYKKWVMSDFTELKGREDY
jgi:glutathione S-transferase